MKLLKAFAALLLAAVTSTALAHHSAVMFDFQNTVVVEVKSVVKFERIFVTQVLTYLRATGCRLGLIINFNVPVLKDDVKRVVL